MANVRVFRAGNWHDTTTTNSPWWTGTTWIVPDSSDVVYTNGFRLQVLLDVTVAQIRTDSRTTSDWKDTPGTSISVTAGGGIDTYTTTPITITSNFYFSAAGALRKWNTGTLYLVGTIEVASGQNVWANDPVECTIIHSGDLFVYPNGYIILGSWITGTPSGVVAPGTPSLPPGSNVGGKINWTTTGNIECTNGWVMYTDASAGIFTYIGNIVSKGDVSTNTLIFTTSGPTLNVYGNLVVQGTGNGPTISRTAGGNTNIIGNIVHEGINRPALRWGTSVLVGQLKISGNILDSMTGLRAVVAPSYKIDPVPTNGYIRYARNGTGVGSDAWLYQFTTDSLSAFSMPPVSAVRFGTTFANNTLTGTCVIPSPSSVAFGVPVDDTTGQAIFTTNTFFDLPLSAVNVPDSIGARIKNAATIESAGYLLASFTTN